MDQVKESLDSIMQRAPHLITTEKKKRIAASFQQLQEENKNLKGEKKNLKNRIDEETNVLQVLMDQADGLKKILSEKDVEINALNSTIKEQSNSIRIFQSTIDEQLKEISECKERIEILDEELKSNLELSKEKQDNLIKELEQEKKKAKELEEKLSQQIDMVTKELESEKQQLETVQRELTIEKDELKQEVEKRKEEVERLEQSILQHQATIADHQSTINVHESTIAQIKVDLEEESNNGQVLAEQLNIVKVDKQSLEESVEQLKQQVGELEKERNEERDKVKQVETKIEEMNETIKSESLAKQEIEHKLGDISIKYEELNKLVIQEQSTNEQLSSDKELLQAEYESMQKDNETMNVELNSRASMINELTMIRSNLNMEIEGVRRSHVKEMEELTNQLTVVQEEHELSRAELARCTGELEMANTDKAALQGKIDSMTGEAEESRVELEKQRLTIVQLESNLREKTNECTVLNRTHQELEYLKETLREENKSIREMIAQGSAGLDERFAEKDELQQKIHSLELTMMEKNNSIEDASREKTTMQTKLDALTADLEQLRHQLSVEKRSHEEEAERSKNELDNISKRHIEEQLDSEQAAELVVNDLKDIIERINHDKDIMEKELGAFAQRLSDQSELVHEAERKNIELQREMDSIVHTRDNLIKELDESQTKQTMVDGANKAIEERLHDLRSTNDNERQSLQKQLNEERQTWESRRWETVAELEQEKTKTKKATEELLEERRRMGVVSKTVEKFLDETSFDNITPESFYAMLEAARKELLEGFQHKRNYYDDEDLLAQLHMEREARRLAESQVEHFAVLLEKKRMELMALKPLDHHHTSHSNSSNSNNRNGTNSNNNSGNGNGGGFSFINNITKSFRDYNNDEKGGNNFLKRTFTGPTRK